jgi:hypothetical protein
MSLVLLRLHVLVQMRKSSDTRSAIRAPLEKDPLVSLKTLPLFVYFTLWASKWCVRGRSRNFY